MKGWSKKSSLTKMRFLQEFWFCQKKLDENWKFLKITVFSVKIVDSFITTLEIKRLL